MVRDVVARVPRAEHAGGWHNVALGRIPNDRQRLQLEFRLDRLRLLSSPLKRTHIRQASRAQQPTCSGVRANALANRNRVVAVVKRWRRRQAATSRRSRVLCRRRELGKPGETDDLAYPSHIVPLKHVTVCVRGPSDFVAVLVAGPKQAFWPVFFCDELRVAVVVDWRHHNAEPIVAASV